MITTVEKALQPYYLGFQHAKLAFTDRKVATAAQNSFGERSQALNAITHLFTAVLLCIPLINYFVYFLVERNREPALSLPGNSVGEERSAPNLQPAAPVNVSLSGNNQDEDFTSEDKILNYFFKQLTKAQEDEKPLDSVPFYNQCHTNLVALAECTSEEAKKLRMEPFLQKIHQSRKISDRLKFMALYYMHNEFVSQEMQSRVALPSQSWTVVKAPADGSCMLWSFLLSERISRGQTEGHTTQRYEGLNSNHPEYVGLLSEMMMLREEIVKRFLSDIKGPLSAEFRKQFVYYVIGNQTVSDAVIISESIDELLKTGDPTPSMINRYVEFISKRDTWCGEFEAEIVAKLKNRTIYILRGTSTENLTLGTIAGIGYMATTDRDPVYIRHSGMHYDALFPN